MAKRNIPTPSRRAAVVGILLVLCVIALIVVDMPSHGRKPMTITAQFPDAVGLYAGNQVAVLGMPVGKVVSVTPKDQFVEVVLEVDPDIDIPANVQAVTVSTSLLTDRHVELTPPYRTGAKLADGDVLGLSRTRTPVEFDRTLAMADKLSRSLGGDGKGQGPLADLIAIGDKVATGSGQDLKATLSRLSDALRLSNDGGAATRRNIQAIAGNLAELTTAAADNDTTIRQFGSQIRQLTDIAADQNLGAGKAGAQLNQVLAEVTTLLVDNRDKIKSTIKDSGALLGTLADKQRELSEVLDVLPMLGDNIYATIDRNVGAFRVHPLLDKLMLNGQMVKEVCNLAGMKDLGCNTGTINDYSPDFGANFFAESMTGLLANMAGPPR